MALRTLLLTILVLAATATTVFSQEEPRHVQVRALPERGSITPGETILVAIEQTIEAGWHTYWVNPGDAGAAPVIDWTLPAGFEAGNIHWPAPHKIMTGPLTGYGYEGKAVLLQELTAPENLPEGPVKLTVTVELLVCAAICIPETSTHEIALNGGAADNEALVDGVYNALPQELDWPATYREEEGNLVLDLEVFTPAFLADIDPGQGIDLMPADWGIVDNPSAAQSEESDGRLVLRQKRGDRPLRALDDLDFLIAWRKTDGSRHVSSVRAVPDRAWKAGLAAAPAAAEAESGGGAPPRPGDVNVRHVNSQAGPMTVTQQNISLAQAILFALLGGLILNLMPCVFPILSLKALKLCELSGKELSHARLHSLLYAGGILLSFAAFAVVTGVLRDAGEQAGWGFQLQNPLFVLLLAWLLFAAGLNLSGFFQAGGSLANIGGRLVSGHGYAASFFTGVLAALVATPCTGPFMAVALGYAILKPLPLILAIFLALGFGLALPYLVLAFVPALRAALPRPGAWMETFRQFLAFPLYASAAWLVWVFSMQGGSLSVMMALTGATLIAFAIWLLRDIPAKGAGRALRPLLAAAAIAGLIGIAGFTRAQPDPALLPLAPKEGWRPYMKDDFLALEHGDDALFVNMTAAWCITCKVNERAALETKEVQDAFARNNVTLVRGDWTNNNPEITEFLLTYGRNGVPLYTYYAPRDRATGKRPEAVVLPQILTPGVIINAIENQQEGD